MGSLDPARSRAHPRRLHIGVDARLVTYRRGMGTYVHNLIHEFARRDDAHQFTLYVDDVRAIAELPSHPRFEVVVLKPRFYPMWEQWALATRVRHDALDVLHCPANTGPIFGLGGARLILTIHDVMYMMPYGALPASPSMYQRLGRLYRRTIVPPAARRAARVITVSNRSALDIRRFLALNLIPVDVIAEAADAGCHVMQDKDEVARACAALDVHHPFVLAPGAVDPRKNTSRVLRAFARGRSALGPDVQLVLFGLTASGVQRFHAEAEALGISEDVRLLGFVAEEELVALYNACQVFLYPSLYEGFGLPLLEAMACGAAIATSHAGSLPEIAGDAAEYSDPLDVESISEALLRANTGRSVARIADGLARAQSFSWGATAALTIESYEAAAADHVVSAEP